MDNLVIIGRSEKVSFPSLENSTVHARIDTGARTSAIWASSVKRKGDTLEVIFWGKSSPGYTGKPVTFNTFGETVVASSNGNTEHRYKIRLLVVLHGRRIRATFTLADRSMQAYPVLVGRNILRKKFVVDVSKGDIPYDIERKRSADLQAIVKKDKDNS